MTYLPLLRTFDILQLLKMIKSIGFRILAFQKALEPTQTDITHHDPEK